MPTPVQSTAAIRNFRFDRVSPDGERIALDRAVAVERPIAIEFNGIGYAVMMASPTDLDDLALGFALSERLVENVRDVIDIDHHRTEKGDIVRVTLSPERAERVIDRVRHRVSESSCGLCGIENLDQAVRTLPMVDAGPAPDDTAIFSALAALRDHQPLNRSTGAVHAAARCRADGHIVQVREDVGRHNAFDKLIGAMRRDSAQWEGGFALLSSRCSYELVEKAALAVCPTLVTVSAPTDLAIDRARECGLRLIVLARSDAMLDASGMESA